MFNSVHFPKIVGILGGFLILSGMLLQSVFEYAPTIGWIGGFLSFIIAASFAYKNKKNKIND